MSEKIKVLLSEEEVDSRIKQIAAKVSKDYAGKEIHLICVLKGGVFFTCELAKRITVPVSLDFMSVSNITGRIREPVAVRFFSLQLLEPWNDLTVNHIMHISRN